MEKSNHFYFTHSRTENQMVVIQHTATGKFWSCCLVVYQNYFSKKGWVIVKNNSR